MTKEDEQLFFKELDKLREKNYLNDVVVNHVKKVYQQYQSDLIEEKRRETIAVVKAKAELSEAEQLNKIKQKEIERREFLNSLVGKTRDTDTSNFTEEQVKPANEIRGGSVAQEEKIAKTMESAVKKEDRAVKERSTEEVRERNLSVVLSLGVIFLLLGGLVLATTNWFMLGSVTKVLLILSISGLFGGMGFVSHKLKIKQTSFAFVSLAFLFLPVTAISTAFYGLFGSYLSLVGPGRTVLGLLLSAVFAMIYYQVAKAYRSTIFKWLSLGLVYSFTVFTALSLTWTLQAAFMIEACFLIAIILARDKWKTTNFFQFFEKEWATFQIIIVGFSSLTILSIANTPIRFTMILGIFLFGMLYLILSFQNEENRLVFQIIGNIFVFFGIVGTLFVESKQIDSLPLVVASLLVVVLLWSVDSKFAKKLPVKFVEVQIYCSYGMTMLLVLFILLLGITIDSDYTWIENFVVHLSSFLLISGIYRVYFLKRTNLTFSGLLVAGYLLLIGNLSLLGYSLVIISYTLCIISLMLYGLVFIFSKLQRKWLVIGITSLVFYLIGSIGIFFTMTVYEQTIWLVVIWGLLLATKLRIPEANQHVFGLVVIVGVPIIFMPALENYANKAWTYVFVSICLLLFGRLMQQIKQHDMVKGSQLLAVGIYLIGCIVLFSSIVLGNADWVGLLILIYGIYLCFVMRKEISMKYNSLVGISLVVVSLLYPLLLLDLTSLLRVLYIEGIAIIFLVIWLLLTSEMKLMAYLKQYSQMVTHGLIILSLLVGGITRNLSYSLVYIVPIVIYVLALVRSKKMLEQRIYLSVSVILMYLLLETLTISWLTSPVILFGLAVVLFGIYWGLPQWKEIVEPVGFGMSLLALVANIPLTNLKLHWQEGIVSVLLWLMICLYLRRYRHVNLDLVKWFGLFVILAWELYSLPFVWYFGVLAFLVLARGLLAYTKKERLVIIKPFSLNQGFVFVMLGYIYLRGLAKFENQGYLEFSLMFFIALYLLVFTRKENQGMERSTLQTLLCISLAETAVWLVQIFKDFLYIPIITALNILIVLILVSYLLRKVWHLMEQYSWLEFATVASGLGFLMLEALYYETLMFQLTFSILALIFVSVGFIWKFKSYFMSGAVGLILSIAYNQRQLWSDIPWWLYLIIGGVVLIAIASSTELRNRQVKKPTELFKKIRSYFTNWN